MSNGMEYSDHLFNQLQDANAELSAVKAENEALRRQLAELMGAGNELHGAVLTNTGFPQLRDDRITDAMEVWLEESKPCDMGRAWLLRKQAEAVEEQAREWSPEDQTYSGRKPHKELVAEAQHLHTQADELEGK